jgi:hypothetical protein
MKKVLSTFLIVLIGFLLGCSPGHKPTSILPGGAIATFDANNVLGNGTIPNVGCANTTWVNLDNSSKNGTIACSAGGGYAGMGSVIDPRRMEFNGTDISVATAISATPADMPSSTWIIWAYPTSVNVTPQQLLSIKNTAGIVNRAVVLDSSYWSVYTGGSVFNAVAADGNTWQHIAVVFTPTDITLYKNGNAFNYGLAPVITNNAQPFTIGRSASGNVDFYQGSIGWVAIYPRALTPTEISNSCNQLASRYYGAICN